MKTFRTKSWLVAVVPILFFAFANVSFAAPPPFTCGSSTVQDVDGNTYGTTNVNGQCWMKENLMVGTMVSGATTQTNNGVKEKYCYGDNPANCLTDGGLYQWDEAMQYSTTEGAGGMCPVGWHIPKDSEWYALENYLKDDGASCDAGRSNYGPYAWGCFGAASRMLFGTPPGLNFPFAGAQGSGSYLQKTISTILWSSNLGVFGHEAWSRFLSSDVGSYSTAVGRFSGTRVVGQSVRCLQDSPPIAQASSGIVFFGNDNIARGCSAIGTWNTSNKTCTMNHDVAGRVIISGDGTTLDGAGYTLSQGSSDIAYGVRVQDAGSVTVKNLHIVGFSHGIYFSGSPSCTAENNIISNEWIGVSFFSSPNSIMRGNTVSGTFGYLGLSANSSDNILIENNTVSGYDKNISLDRSSFIAIRNNTLSGGYRSIELRESSDNQIAENQIFGAQDAGVYFSDAGSPNSFRNTLSQNIFRDSNVGVFSTIIPPETGVGGFSFVLTFLDTLFPKALAISDNDNIFFHNDFINNTQDVSLASADLMRFSKLAPDGGNFWDKNTDCADANADGFCDTPYLVSSFGVSDGLPRVYPMNWVQPPPIITLTNPAETEDDGVQDTKGVADKTKFTFDILYTGTAAPSDITLWTNDGSVTSQYLLAISATTTNDGIFTNGEYYTVTKTFPKGHYSYHFEANGGAQRFHASGELGFTTGYSNVIFFPGIMGSRLFEQSSECWTASGEAERWYSRQDCYQQRLALDANGKSSFPLYTKEGPDGATATILKDIYASFMSDLKNWKETDHIIADYTIIPYDWRLSLDDILQNGASTTDARLSYGTYQGFDAAYIYKKLKEMQASSDTGKVTIIGHSNGGLVTKALIQKLKDKNDPLANEIDDIIFVAVPQIGTPDATAGILFGTKIGGGVVMGPLRSRSLLQNMPVGYNLLPSPAFGVSVSEPFIEFEGDAMDPTTTEWYGDSIDTYSEFTNYLLGVEGRATPTESDINSPTKANAILLASSTETHRILDNNWAPGNGTTISEIAGWGLPTPAGLRYSKNKECIVDWRTYVPILRKYVPHCSGYRDVVKIEDRRTLNGDETVMEKSAHFIPESETVKKYWVNLEGYNKNAIDRTHKDILQVTPLRPFILSIIKKNISVPQFMTADPSTLVPNTNGFAVYYMHSPLNLNVYDNLGNHTGISPDTGLLEVGIKGSHYYELGDTKTIIIPSDITHTLELNAYASGSFTLDIKTMVGDTITASTTFEAVPTATTTKATLSWNPQEGITPATSLNIDFNADNIVDISLPSSVNGTTLYDVTPPEAIITFDPAMNDVVFHGTDAGGDTAVKMAETSVTITDVAGNTTVIPFTKFKDETHKLQVVFDTIIYNGISTDIPKTTLNYEWGLNKDGTIKQLIQNVLIKNTRIVTSEYNSEKNETKISDKGKEEDKEVTKSTKSGVVVLTTSTQIGVVGVQY